MYISTSAASEANIRGAWKAFKVQNIDIAVYLQILTHVDDKSEWPSSTFHVGNVGEPKTFLYKKKQNKTKCWTLITFGS